MIVMGIDPGLKGGIGIINNEGLAAHVFPMPLLGPKDVDCAKLQDYIRSYRVNYCVLEHQQAMPKDSKVGIFTLAKQYGQLLAVLQIMRVPFISPGPKLWKEGALRGTKKDKAAAIKYALQKYPRLKSTIGKHDGMAEALCIAEYAFWKGESVQVSEC